MKTQSYFFFIYLGGNNISPGYYKNPIKTKEEFFEYDGKWWFKTGDIGQLESDGAIKIIGKIHYLVIIRCSIFQNNN